MIILAGKMLEHNLSSNEAPGTAKVPQSLLELKATPKSNMSGKWSPFDGRRSIYIMYAVLSFSYDVTIPFD